MRKISTIFWMTMLVAGVSSPAGGASREIPTAKDNTLFDLTPDTLSNGAGPYFFVGKNSQGNTRRGLIKFAVADSLPAGAVIDSVELRLNMSQAQNTTPRLIVIRIVTNDWGEGDSFSDGGGGAPAEAGDATWLHRFFPDLFWSLPGGDFLASVSAFTFVGGAGTYRWSSPVMTADVQTWLDHPASNFGWIVIGDESVVSTARRFDSHENPTVENRPALVVHYSTDVPVRPSTWGGVKARTHFGGPDPR